MVSFVGMSLLEPCREPSHSAEVGVASRPGNIEALGTLCIPRGSALQDCAEQCFRNKATPFRCRPPSGRVCSWPVGPGRCDEDVPTVGRICPYPFPALSRTRSEKEIRRGGTTGRCQAALAFFADLRIHDVAQCQCRCSFQCSCKVESVHAAAFRPQSSLCGCPVYQQAESLARRWNVQRCRGLPGLH